MGIYENIVNSKKKDKMSILERIANSKVNSNNTPNNQNYVSFTQKVTSNINNEAKMNNDVVISDYANALNKKEQEKQKYVLEKVNSQPVYNKNRDSNAFTKNMQYLKAEREFENKYNDSEYNRAKKVYQDKYQPKTSSRSIGLGLGWIDSGSFSDGYQFGDLTKSIIGTGANVASAAVKGIGGVVEGTSDALTYGVADVADWLGAKEFADEARRKASKNDYDEILKPVDEIIDKNSFLGEKSENVIRGLGQVGTTTLLGIAGGTPLTTGSTLISSYGSSVSQALNEGASVEDARTYGLINSVAEAGSEMLFGGLGKFSNALGLSKGAIPIDDLLAKKISQKFSSAVAKNITQYGIKASAEGAEEVISGLASAIGKKMTYMSDEELSKLIEDENLLESFITGAVTSAFAQSSDLVKSVKNNTDYITGESLENNSLQNSMYERIINSTNTNETPAQQNDTIIKNNGVETENNIGYNQDKGDMFDGREGIYRRTETGVNLERNTMGTLGQKKGNGQEQRSYSREEYSKFERTAQQYRATKVGTKSRKIAEDIKNNFGKEVVFFDDTKTLYKGGASLENNNTIYISANKDLETQKFIAGHEVLESNIAHNIQEKKAYIDIAIEEILNDTGFAQTKENFGLDQNLGNISDRLIAKDIICDLYAQEQSGIPIDYEISLSPETLEVIKYNTDMFNEKIKNKSKIENSFKQPTVEERLSHDVKLFNLENNKKIMNPNEISTLTKENSTTTPSLPKIKRNGAKANKESSFYGNVTEKSKFLSEKSRNILKSEEDINYYKGVSNEESLKKASERLDNGGSAETLNWFQKDSTKATAIDVAEGWILMKRYQDAKDYDSMVEVAKKMREMGTSAGQTVQAYNIMARLTPEGMVKYAQSELTEAFDKLSKNKTKQWIDKHRTDFDLNTQEVEFIIKQMEDIKNTKSEYDKKVKLAEIQKLMTDKLPPSKGAGIKSWMRISMLFNPKTQVRNIAGNAVIMPVNAISDLTSSAIDRFIASKTGVRTTGTTSLKSQLKGFKKGLYESYNDFKKGINTRNIEGNRFEITEGKSFSDKNILGKSLNRVDNVLSFMLDAGDRGFYEATFTNSINNQLALNKTTEVTQEMIDIATQEALSRTWQDNNNYTKFVLNIRKGLNFGKNYGLGDILIPFAKTPANLTKAIVDYSPVGLVNSVIEGVKLKRSVNNGQFTPQLQHRFVQNLGKATAGTMLYVLGYALAKAGITTGESDEDSDVANFLKNTLGVNSYSIKIGNKTFTYDWAQPVAAPFEMMANLVQKQEDGETLSQALITTLDTGLNVIFEQSFLESMSNFLSEPGQIGTKLAEQFLDLPARSVPTLFKQVTDMVDGTQRTTFEKGNPFKTAVNKVKAKVPGLSQTLAPTVDTMGREIQKYGGENNIFNVFFNPANMNKGQKSKSAEEIYKVYQETGDKTIFPRVAPYSINIDGKNVNLTPKQRTEFQKISGKIIEDNVKKLKNNGYYDKLSYEEKIDVINGIVNYSYNKAKEDVLGIRMSNTYNKVNEWLDEGKSLSDYYANKEENNYALSNKEKYNTITGLDVTYDNYAIYQKEVSSLKKKYEGTENTKIRKQKVAEYINSLPLRKYQKIMLYKELGGYSIAEYKDEMYQHINSLKISKSEKEEIWKRLYG